MFLNDMHIQPGMAVDVGQTAFDAFYRDKSAIDMIDIMARRQGAPLTVAIARGLLAVRSAGTYALLIRLDQPAAATANCIVRLAPGQHRIVSSVRGSRSCGNRAAVQMMPAQATDHRRARRA